MHRFITFFKNLKFKQKLIFSYLVVILIPITVLGSYFFIQSKTFLQQQTMMVLNQNIQQMADNINYKFEKYNAIIESLSFSNALYQVFNTDYTNAFALYSDLKYNVDSVFNSTLFLNQDVQKVFLYTDNKSVPKRVDSIGEIEDIRDQDWFVETKKDWRTNWYYMDGKLFGAHILFKQTAMDLDNMVCLYLKYGNVFSGIQNQLMTDQGILLYDNKKNIIFYEDKTPGNVREDMAGELIKSSGDTARIHDVNYIVIKRDIASTSWTLCFFLPVSSVTIDTNKIIAATAIIIVACLIILLFIIWIFSTTFVKRINYLNNRIKMVAAGDMSVEISSRSKDEIGELINGFGLMLKNINVLINEVYQSKVTQKEAELKALKAQIKPHFLYNSLSLINWRAIKIKAADISHITTTLSKFYRTSLNKGDNIISVRDEIENTKAYVEIQLIRHDYSFDVFYEIQEDVLEFDMINLILQPIVENAVEHGIDAKREGRGEVRIRGGEYASYIELAVEDNGPGMTDVQADQILIMQSKGYGLKNIQERLKLFFGDEYGLTVKTQPERGTCVTLKMPKYKRLPPC